MPTKKKKYGRYFVKISCFNFPNRVKNRSHLPARNSQKSPRLIKKYMYENICFKCFPFPYLGHLVIHVICDLRNNLAKCFQSLRQSYMLSPDWIEIHQPQPASMMQRRSEGHISGCDWWILIWPVDNMQDWWKFQKHFGECFDFWSCISMQMVVIRWSFPFTKCH